MGALLLGRLKMGLRDRTEYDHTHVHNLQLVDLLVSYTLAGASSALSDRNQISTKPFPPAPTPPTAIHRPALPSDVVTEQEAMPFVLMIVLVDFSQAGIALRSSSLLASVMHSNDDIRCAWSRPERDMLSRISWFPDFMISLEVICVT